MGGHRFAAAVSMLLVLQTINRTASPQPIDVAQPVERGGLPTGTIMLAALALAVVVLVGAGALMVVRRRTGGDDEQPYAVKKPPKPKAAPKRVPKVVTNTKAVARTQRSTPSPADTPVRRQPAPVTPLPRRSVRSTPVRRPVEHSQPAEPPAAGPTGDEAEWLVAGDLRVSPTLGEAWSGERRVDLTPAELRVLELLIAGGDRGVTRDALAEAGELDEGRAGPDAVDAIVTQVRRKTAIRGRGHVVRKERVVTYFLE